MDGGAPLRIGVVGLGRAFTLMLPTFVCDPRVRLVAACDPIAGAREQFVRDFAAAVYSDAASLCADAQVEVVYIASPHQLHREHVELAASHGRHVLLEKPMAITVDECTQMIAAMAAAGRTMVVGHSHSFDAPVLRARALIDAGAIGRVRMIHALNYTDFLYRPRRPEELRTADGGGVVHSQAAHQIDIVRLLGGGRVRSVRAATGDWDPDRPTEGAYSALLEFEDGAFASLTYNGYGFFDSDEWMGWRGELGARKQPGDYGAARCKRAAFSGLSDEVAAKAARNYGGSAYVAAAAGEAAHQHFGPLIVSGERGDLRLLPDGVELFTADERRVETLPPPTVPRAEVIDELWRALRAGGRAAHDGAWARATTEVSLAILQSARRKQDVLMQWQVPWQS